MDILPEASEVSDLDLQLEDRLSIQLETTVHSQNDIKSEDSEEIPKLAINTSVSRTERPLLCKDILYMLHHWTSSDSIHSEYACTSGSEDDLTEESDSWSDNEEGDSDESVLCLTSHGPRPLDSTNSLCPSLPRRLSFKPLETVEERSDGPTALDSESHHVQCEVVQHPITPGLEWPTNVIFQNDFFAVSESTIAGWGAFATKDLKYGDRILIEKPLFTADSSSLFKEFDRLNRVEQEVALALHANDMCKPGTPKLQAIWTTNCFATGKRDNAGLFPIASRFNHSCYPKDNIEYTFDHIHDCLEMIVKADRIAAGEELTITYGTKRTPMDLFMRYGFRCRCGACPGLVETTKLVAW
ncbi:hypothetical protein BGZ61DRAFT_530781 [Ilyonectria robusta]|uniref:uncharacterized protein n=1 Tax=Ilyonectria robusta TaxID=1079257 RepID=UPI001E8DC513|nr:uncharacterized protein BGZ61DRAFT_530781 [Ilyonectria robusta]KAH8714113.1 hypothetical protein BGZ61DRAFT_530781 [Ilyonectria robusta]